MINIDCLLDDHDDDLELYLGGRLHSERTASVEQHLLECNICRERLSECVGHRLSLYLLQQTEPEQTQKRSEPRFSTEGEATVQEIHPLSLERHKVKVVNVSKSGLGILSPKAIFPGTIVQLRIQDSIELGNVRYCSASGDDGFRIGLRLHGEG
jgi:predicted anti-sigma-YlaC factor YlaD